MFLLLIICQFLFRFFDLDTCTPYYINYQNISAAPLSPLLIIRPFLDKNGHMALIAIDLS